MDIFKDAVEDSAAKITKSFEKILIEVIILFMVIPRKINFTQMGRYGLHVEQTYRNAFGLKKSKCIDWLKLNVSLAKRFLGKQGRWAIAIDPNIEFMAVGCARYDFSRFGFEVTRNSPRQADHMACTGSTRPVLTPDTSVKTQPGLRSGP